MIYQSVCQQASPVKSTSLNDSFFDPFFISNLSDPALIDPAGSSLTQISYMKKEADGARRGRGIRKKSAAGSLATTICVHGVTGHGLASLKNDPRPYMVSLSPND